MLTPRWTPLRYHEQQSRLWRTNARFIACCAGRGSGKTEIAKRKLIRRLPVRVPGCPRPKYFFAAPTNKQAKKVAWQDLKDLTPPRWMQGKPSETEHVILTKFGSELHLVGLDEPARIEGVQWCGGVGDESSDTKPEAFNRSIRPALSHWGGFFWRIGVPKRYGVGAFAFRQCFLPDSYWEQYSWPSSDILTSEEIALAKETMDEHDYLEQYEASWLTAGGLAFHAFDEAVNVRRVPYDPSLPIVVGSDFNVNPMAWVLGHQLGKQRFGVFDELWLRDSNTSRTLDTLYARYGQHKGGWEFNGDATGAARKTSASRSDYIQIRDDTRFKSARVRYPRSNPPIKDRIASCNAMLCNARKVSRLFIDPCCTHLITDMQVRAIDKYGTAENHGDIGHITDALGYIIHIHYPIRVGQTGRADIGTVKA